MNDLKKALKVLQKAGCIIVHGEGSRMKVYPPDRSKPFYTLHANPRAFHPLRRFSARYWGINF